MPRGVYDRKKVKSTKGGRKLIKAAKSALKYVRTGKGGRTYTPRRRNTPGVHDDIPTISRSALTSSISPRSSSSYAERTVEVERGTTLIIKIV